MKSKGFKWLLHLLSEASIDIKVLDTYFLRNFYATDVFVSENSAVQHRKLQSDQTSRDIIEHITIEKPLFHTENSIKAIGYLRENRIFFTDPAIQDFYQNPHHNFTMIQKCAFQCNEICSIFSISLFLKETSYQFSLFSKQDKKKKKVKNVIWVQRIKDILNSIIFIIQDQSGHRVKSAKIELVKDSKDFFWLSYFHASEFIQITNRECFKVVTPELSDLSGESSIKSENEQLSLIKMNNRTKELFNNDFLEMICRKRIKERMSPDLKLPSKLFYAEFEEINAEKANILRMIQDTNTLSKPLKNEKSSRRTMWIDQSPRKSNMGVFQRISSPFIFKSEKSLKQLGSPQFNCKNFLRISEEPIRQTVNRGSFRGLK